MKNGYQCLGARLIEGVNIEAGKIPWQLWRQDDNGRQFLVGAYNTREAAEARMAELMQGHHKQTYWISRDSRKDCGNLAHD